MVGCASNKAIDSIVARLFNGEEHLESYGLKKDFPLGGKRVIGTPAHYAYLKIAEGCNNRCHYCAIPGIRGPLRSREMADCVAEARWLAGEGVKELIIVAQDPTAYGEDWGKPGSICELLDKLNKIPRPRVDPHHVRLPGAHHRRLHRRHEAEREGPALSRSAHPALQRHDPEKT